MFSSIGWTEMMVIAIVAIIFVGPKDLPSMLRAFGRFSRKARGMASDFQRQVDDALREAELDDVRKSIEDVRSLDPKKALKDRILGDDDALREAAGEDDYDPETLFDESKAPEVEPAQKVDVEAALKREEERQREANAAAASSKSAAAKAGETGVNGVPGLAKPAKPKAKKAPARKPASKKPAAKAAASRTAAAKPRKVAARKPKAASDA